MVRNSDVKTWAVFALGCTASAFVLAAPVDNPLRFSGKIDGEARTWSFPFLVDAENSQVAARINEYLHMAELQSAPPASPQISVQVVEGEDAMPVELESEGVGVLNAGRVIEVGFFRREKGIVYGEHARLQFDARNGAVIWAQDILTPAGKRALALRALKARAANLDQEERKLEAQRKRYAATKKGKTPATIDDYIATFDDWRQSCFNDKASADQRDPGVVRLAEGGLRVEAIACNGRSVDNIAPFSFKLSATEAAPYLTAYAKFLLSGEGPAQSPPSRPFGRVLHGTINKGLNVTMYIGRRESDGHFFGYYYYDKYRQLIPLSGRESAGGTFDIKEGDAAKPNAPHFSLQQKGDRLTGKWRDGRKTFNAELRP